MATEKLNINGLDSGWSGGGFVSNIDEAVSAADGAVVSTTALNAAVIFEFDATSSIADTQLVTDVSVTVRARFLGSQLNPKLTAEWLINDVSQGAISDLALTNDFQNISRTLSTDDLTQSDLNGIQLKLTATSDDTDISQGPWQVDCIDLDVTYELGIIEVDAGALALSGKAPDDQISDDFKYLDVDPYDGNLTGYAPVVGKSISTNIAALSVAGQFSYVNPTTETANPDFAALRPGWEGFLANIDEPVSSPDGDTMYYDRTSGDFTAGEVLRIGFPSFSNIDDTNEILGVDVVARLRSEVVGAGTVTAANAFISIYIDGQNKGTQGTYNIPESFSNLRISNLGWDQDWTSGQLNSLELRVEFVYGTSSSDAPVRLYIDAIDLEVTYAEQSPIRHTPARADVLSLTGVAPTVKYTRAINVTMGTLALSEQTPTFKRTYTGLPFKIQRNLNGKIPFCVVDFRPQTLIGNVNLTGKAETITVDYLINPSVYAATVTGKVPDPADTANHAMVVPRGQLTLLTKSLVVPETGKPEFIVPRLRQYLTGQIPSQALVTIGPKITPAAAAVSLDVTTPAAVGSTVRALTEQTLDLTMQSPLASRGTLLTISDVNLTLSTALPQLGLLPATVTLTGQAPIRLIVGFEVPVAAPLTITGRVPTVLVAAIMPETSSLTLTGQPGPTLAFSTSLTPGQPGLVGLSIDYSIEFINTPTNIIVD